MGKLLKRIISFTMILTILTSLCIFVPTVSAAKDEVRYTQKVVAVVYDNSGSMAYGLRNPAAKYSLSLLMSLLDARDDMRLVPMNRCPSGGISVDLSASNRDAVVNNIIKNSILDSSGGTPSKSMQQAVSILTSLGLKDKNHLKESPVDKEFWLVVLTDGLFEDVEDSGYQATQIVNAIANYPTLHTVYTSFGSGAIDISDRPELKQYPFLTTYCKVPETPTAGKDDLVSVMQKIANQISGRYPLGDTQYQVNGNTVTIDLAQIPFSISSLSVIAQNCGANVQSVSYENPAMENKANVRIDKQCSIVPHAALSIKKGCSFKTISDTYLFGGTLTYTFDGPVSVTDLSIFAEPALNISTYMETMVNGTAKRVDAQYINSNLGKGEKISVGYEVFEQVNNTLIDLEKVFGKVDAKVIYNQKTYTMGEQIPLVVGSHDLSIEVSVMDGAFTLRRSELITVEEDPSFFRVEAQGDDSVSGTAPQTSAIFTVYLNNAPASKAILDTYNCNAVATTSDGTILFDKQVSPGADGKITVPLKLETNEFDVYTITLTVESPDMLSRVASHSVTYVPNALELSINGSNHLTVTQEQLRTNTEGFIFTLSANGQPFPFVNGITEYKLLAGSVDLTEYVTVQDSTLTFIPDTKSLGSLADQPCDLELSLAISSKTHPNLATSAIAKLTIEKTIYTVVPLTTPSKAVDRFNLSECNAALFFSVLHDDIPYTEEELKTLLEDGSLTIEKDFLFQFFLLPAGTTATVETVNGTPAVAIRIEEDMGSYLAWHFSAFISGGEKDITVSYKDASGTDSFNVIPSNIFQHILRIACLILEIALICYLTCYILGFFIAKPLPKGVFIRISSTGDYRTSYVNESLLKYVLWHLTRLNPKLMWVNQSPEGQAPSCTGMMFSHGKQNTINMTPKNSDSIYSLEVSTMPNIAEVLDGLHTAISNGQQYGLRRELAAVNASVEKLLMIPFGDTPIEARSNAAMSSEVYYGYFTANPNGRGQRLNYAICFKKLS